MRKVLGINTALPGGHYELGRILLIQERVSEAAAEFAAEKDPGWALFGPPLALHAQGRKREAQAAFDVYLKDPDGSEFQVAETYGYFGDLDKAFAWLDIAYRKRDPGFIWVRGNPMLKALKSDPRYAKVLDKLK